MRKIMFLFSLMILAGCTQPGANQTITNFQECVDAGNPVMESYPRQCTANGQTFTEEIEMCLSMSIEQAITTAQASQCAEQGNLTNNYVCNENTGTVWVDLTVEDMPGCSPACVVNVQTGEVEINYRCTGLIMPEEDACNMTEVNDSEGNTYPVVSIGDQCWMAKNLNIGMMIQSNQDPNPDNQVVEKWCYNNNETHCKNGGGLYSWNESMSINETHGICPEGWHIPSDEEFKILEMHLGMTQEQADDLQELLHRGTDQGTQLKAGGASGFNAQLSGFRHESSRFYGHENLTASDQAYYWTSTELDSSAWVRGLSSQLTVRRQTITKDSGLSIRCIKDQ